MSKKPITPGLYFFHNGSNVDGGAQMTGSNLTLTWAQLEPYKNKPDYARIDTWVGIERARGHKWVLRIDVHQNRGARSLPGWAPKLSLALDNGAKVDVPNYAHPALASNLAEFVELIGARYDADPDLVLVQIGLGLYGETHPERNDEQGQLASQIALQLSGCQWIDYCKRVIDAYVTAFPTTELVIMNAPAFPFGCRATTTPFATSYPREVIDSYALSIGVGAQNNSLDMWDAGWYTAVVQGSQGAKTVHGSVGPFQERGRMLAMERGSWLAPFPTMVDQGHAGSMTWWSYLNALSKGARAIFPPNWPGAVWHNGVKVDYKSGVWNYNGAYATELRWMNQVAIDVMADKTLLWAAFNAPDTGAYYYATAQHTNHERGIALDARYTMKSEWDDAGAKPPFYESMFMRRVAGDVVFYTTAGRYQVMCWHRGTVRLLGREFRATGWTRQAFVADVPSTFGLSGDGHLHAIILEPAGVTPPPPPPPPEEPETFAFTTKAGQRITVTVG